MTEILVIYPHDNLSTNPTMFGLVQELATRGVAVSIMTPTKLLLEKWVPSSAASVRLLSWPPPYFVHPTGRRSIRRALKSAFAARRLQKYSAILGADPAGIAIASRLNDRARRPLVYLSFELIFEREVENAYEVELKLNERAAARASDLILIQDEERRDAFCEENGVDPARCVLVPVAPVDARPKRTNYLRDKLGIPTDKTIVLYQGSLYDWSCRNEFAEMVSYWSDEFRLVIHSRDQPGKRMMAFMRELCANSQIYFTNQPVPPSELPILTASADVGLACYRATFDSWLTGKNLRLLGLASGKIAYYTMCGLPVLARSLASIEAIQAKYRFGLSYKRISESASALKKITANWDSMSKAARAFYEERLDPDQPIRYFCDRLLSMAA